MSKSRESLKKVVHTNKTVMQNHLISLVLLVLGFLIFRYGVFDLHGMKEWPLDLLIAGVLIWFLSLLGGKKYAPWFIPAGYFLGFWMGVLLHTEGTDPGGGTTDNLWIIWTVVFLACILAGIVTEIVIKWHRLLKHR